MQKKKSLVLRQDDTCTSDQDCSVDEQCCDTCIPSSWACCDGGPWFCEVGVCQPCSDTCTGNYIDGSIVYTAPWSCATTGITSMSSAAPTTSTSSAVTTTSTTPSATTTTTPIVTNTPSPPPSATPFIVVSTRTTPPLTTITPTTPSTPTLTSSPTTVSIVTVPGNSALPTSTFSPTTFPALPSRTNQHDDLLRGYCITPLFSELLGPQSTIIYYVGIVGCMNDKPDCCPYTTTTNSTTITTTTTAATTTTTTTAITTTAITTTAITSTATTTTATVNSQQLDFPAPPAPNQQTLTVCPGDYQTISNVCCPSGYDLWTEEVGGVTPCFSTLPSNSYLTPPPPPVTPTTSVAPGAPSTATNTIVNVVYAQNFPVQRSGGLTVGAKAGVGIGAGIAGIAALAGLVFLLLRRRRNERIGSGYAQPLRQVAYNPADSP